MGLARYKEKRDFKRTPEPPGKVVRRKAPALSFVIQKHDATRLHYDFRLEMEGVLKSWAVPKGLPTSKGDRRLAMEVEDHPLDYGGFEGIIPEGNYGAGTVMLWDRGSYEVFGAEPLAALTKGHLDLALHGRKLKGQWTLVRMRPDEKGKVPWLIFKRGEDMKPIPARLDDQSVLTRRTMKQIASGKSRVWHSNRTGENSGSTIKKTHSVSAKVRSYKDRQEPSPESDLAPEIRQALHGLPRESPGFCPPMKALLVEKPPSGPGWIYEIKWDGFRVLGVKARNQVRLYSRNQRVITQDFSDIAEALRQLPGETFVIDGEVVALSPDGQVSFQLLQNQRHQLGVSVCYYAFDLLHLQHRNLRNQPLARRKELLRQWLEDGGGPLRFSAGISGDPEIMLAQARARQIEGIVAKDGNSPYEPGCRSGAWQKIKISTEQEFVIGGYTQPKGTRPYFGALVVGYYEAGKLLYAARVGTGYTERLLRDLYTQFQVHKTGTCPFVNLPTPRDRPFGQGLTRADMAKCTWLKPSLVCQVRFTEWTRDGGLRHPVFLGLRRDKHAEEVVREVPNAG